MCDREENDLGVENDEAEEDEDARQEQEEWMRLQRQIDDGNDDQIDVSPEAAELWG